MEIHWSMLIVIGYNKHNFGDNLILNRIALKNCKLCFVIHYIARHIKNFILSYGLHKINVVDTTVNYNLYNIIL